MGEEAGMGEEPGPGWVEVAPGVRVRADGSGGPRWGSAGPPPAPDHGGDRAAGDPALLGGTGRGADWWPAQPGEGATHGWAPRSDGAGGGWGRPLRWALGVLAAGVLLVVLARGLGPEALPAAPAAAPLAAAVPEASAPGPTLAGDAPPADGPSGDGASGAVSGAVSGGAVEPDLAAAAGAASEMTVDADPASESAEGLGEPGRVTWWEVLEILDSRRSAALADMDAQRVRDYAGVGSPVWLDDTALIADLRTRGLAPVGLSTDVIAIEEAPERGPGDSGAGGTGAGDSDPDGTGAGGAGLPTSSGQVEVVLVDRRSAYQLHDALGEVVEEVPASALRRWRVTLVPDATGDPVVAWRMESVHALP